MPTPSWVFLHDQDPSQPLPGTALPAYMDSRAFRYGDGLFETILSVDARPANLSAHLQRFSTGLDILGLEHGADFLPRVAAAISMLASKHPLGCARIRVQAWRMGAGSYLPSSDQAAFFVEIHPLPEHPWRDPALNPIRIGIYHEIPLIHSPLSAVKTCSALPYVMAARHAARQQWQDALLRSQDGGIAEASASNVFIRRGTSLITPGLKSGCLPGTLRQRIIELAPALGFDIGQQRIDPRELDAADEIFLCNAIRGIQAVSELHGSPFHPQGHHAASQLYQHLRP